MINEEKSSLISLIESYKPDGNYYDGYHNFDRQVDETVCNCLDNVIAEIKQMPTSNAWIKCSEQMPDYGKEVLVCDATYGNVFNAVLCRKKDEDGDNWFTDCDYINYKAFTHWMPMPIPPLETL